MTSSVSIVRAEDYRPDDVLKALRECLAPLGGMGAFVKPGQKVLLKPNILGGFTPDRAVTTHPSIVRAAGMLVQEAGGTVLVGDSPGVGTLTSALRKTGIGTIVEELGAQVADFETRAVSLVEDNRVAKRIELAKAAQDADVVITLPKLKSHVQMGFTCAIKNQFGFVVGPEKAKYHYRMQDRDWLADFMIEINRTVRPALAIVDAIVGMEGEGPSSGDPRPIGALIAGNDLTAVDAICCRIANIDPDTLPLLRAASRYAYGTSDLAEITTHGPSWKEFHVPDFKTVDQPVDILRLLPIPAFMYGTVRRHLVPGPVILPDKCVKCNACKNGCPVDPPAIDPGLEPSRQIDHARCIRCYCCHEFCPEKAIELRASWANRLFRIDAVLNWFSRNAAERLVVGRKAGPGN